MMQHREPEQTDVKAAAEMIGDKLAILGVSPHTAVILGSGLGAAGRMAIEQGGVAIDYADIPNMPQPAVAGHAGRLIIGAGDLAGVLFLQGRVHYYEGHALERMTFATRLMSVLGVRHLIVSNAAGGITSGYQPGDVMLISGHWTLLNIQEPSAQNGRTLPPSKLWSPRLRQLGRAVATTLSVHEGTYAMMSGPNYETPAEVLMLRTFHVDAVGMSTVPEACAAARRGIEVLGVSCITNVASGLSDQPLDHAEVSETAASVESEFTSWLFEVLKSVQPTSRYR
jgi:purine-nucleoside phosphorylase